MINSVVHIGIVVNNMEDMVKFYCDKLGMSFIKEDNNEPGRTLGNLKIEKKAVFLNAGNTVIELLDYEPFTEERGKMATRETPGLAHIAFEVDDIDKTVSELEAKGIVFDIKPIDCGTCTVAFFTDPEGNILEFYKEK